MNILSGPILHQLIGVLSYPSIYSVSDIPGGDCQTSATSNNSKYFDTPAQGLSGFVWFHDDRESFGCGNNPPQKQQLN